MMFVNWDAHGTRSGALVSRVYAFRRRFRGRRVFLEPAIQSDVSLAFTTG